MSAALDAPGPLPGMIRMIVVNTHRMKNRIEELPLDGHTAIIAKNQSGKTSLMKLLPFFWGAEMRQIQQPSAEKKNFIEFYLPTESSYVACEYRNARGDVRSVVVHSDPQKASIQYRLIRGHLSEDLFLITNDDGSKTFVKNVDFESNARRVLAAENLRNPRTVHSKLITSTRDYRGIIQGRVPEGSNDKTLFRGLIEDYGIGRLSAPLDNVDRLFLTMLDNNFALSDLLSIVTNKAMESKSMTVSILGASNSPDNLALAEDFRAYRRVMAMEPMFRDAETTDNRRRAYEAELALLLARLSRAISLGQLSVEKMEAELVTNRDASRAREDDLTKTINATNERLSTANGEIKGHRREITRLEKIEADLRAAGADKAALELEQRPALQAELDTTRKTIDALNGDRDRIEARFSRITDEAREACRVQAAAIDARLIAIPGEIDVIKSAALAASAKTKSDVISKHAMVMAGSDVALNELAARRDAISDRLSDLKADDELVRIHELQLTRVAERSGEFDKISAKAKASGKDADTAHEALIAAQLANKQAKSRVETLERREMEIRAQREPEPGTLRHWLERNTPEWRETIGKVIREDLLVKKDVNPFADDGKSFFGVHVDLTKVESGCASLENLEGDLLSVMADLEAARIQQADAAKAEASAASTRQKAMKQRDSDQAQADISANNLKTARTSEQDASRDVVASLSKKRAELQKERTRIDGDIAGLRAKISAKKVEETKEIQHLDDEASTRANEDVQHLIAEQKSALSAKSDLSAQEAAKLSSIQADKAAALEKEGTDPARIKELVAREAELSLKLQALERLASQKAAWDDFMAHQKPQIASLKDQVAVAERDVEVLTGDVKTLTVEREATQMAARKFADEISAKRDKMQARVARGEAKLKSEAKGGIAGIEDEIDPLLIDDISEEIDQRKAELKKAFSEIASAVRKLKIGFTDVHGRIRESYMLRAKSLQSAEGPEWLAIFADWYDSTHLMVRSAIHDLLPMVSAPIFNAYKRLEEFDHEIGLVSRRLRAAIAGLAQFPGISDVDLNFRSHIKQIDFWADLEGFVKIWREWTRDPAGMEADQLVEALERLLKRFPNGANPEVNLRDMLYIEGSLKEGLDTRRITRDTDLGKLSSEGGASILRLIILTAAVHLIRDGSDVRFTWCVDEFGRLDRANSRHLLEMLTNNGITLVTGAPDLNHGIRSAFANRISINVIPELNTTTLITVDDTGKSRIGIRAWNEGEIGFAEENN